MVLPKGSSQVFFSAVCAYEGLPCLACRPAQDKLSGEKPKKGLESRVCTLGQNCNLFHSADRTHSAESYPANVSANQILRQLEKPKKGLKSRVCTAERRLFHSAQTETFFTRPKLQPFSLGPNCNPFHSANREPL